MTDDPRLDDIVKAMDEIVADPVRVEAIEAEVARQVKLTAARIELACEAALQLGDRGVLIYRDDAGEVQAKPDKTVPYGTIHDRSWAGAPLR